LSNQKVSSTEYSSYELEIERRGEVLIYDEDMKWNKLIINLLSMSLELKFNLLFHKFRKYKPIKNNYLLKFKIISF